jgi:hypothetical protein
VVVQRLHVGVCIGLQATLTRAGQARQALVGSCTTPLTRIPVYLLQIMAQEKLRWGSFVLLSLVRLLGTEQ